MHVQARVSPKSSGFADDDDTSGAISTTYRVGALEEILGVLQDGDFNIRSASGGKIELGGEFGFAVGRDGDEDHEQRTHAAVEALRGQGFDAHVVDVQTRLLDDGPGALRAFVAEVSAGGLLIEEIAVGTPSSDGKIPVQIYTASTEDAPQSS
jgi:hypothetical protein